MIHADLYLAFVAAVVVLMLIPGPNVALTVANAIAHGPRYGFLTMAGTSSAMVIQLTATGLGLAGLLGQAGHAFEWLRWIGVVYLVWLGIAQWRAPAPDLASQRPEARSPRRIYLRALFVSLTNPKTLLFYGAFFPQFVEPGQGAAQIVVLAVTFILIALTVDSGWVLMASRLRHLSAVRGRLRNRVTGGLLIGAGAGLALAHGK